MALFDQSTHVNNWIMDQSFRVKARLTTIREYQENKANATIHEQVVSCSTFDEQMEFTSPSPAELAALREEDVIIRHFSETVQDIVGPPNASKGTSPHFQKSWRLQATSLVYFQRFYLFNSLSVFDPRKVMLSCIFLAGKTEHDFIEPADLVRMKGVGCTLQQLMHMELVVLEGLNFDTKVYHPQNLCQLIVSQALEAAADEANGEDRVRVEREVLLGLGTGGSGDSNVSSTGDDVSVAFKKLWRDTALLHIDQLMAASASLHYSPAVIAVFALQLAQDTMRPSLTTELKLLGLTHVTVALKMWIMYTGSINPEFADTVVEIADWFRHEATPVRAIDKVTIRKQYLSKLKASAYWNSAVATAGVSRDP